MEQKLKLKREAYQKRLQELQEQLGTVASEEELEAIGKKIRNVERNMRKYMRHPEREDYTVNVKFVFEGCAKVYAYSKEEAKQIVKDSFGMTCGELKSDVPNIIDWKINMKPDKVVK